jgi:hypothetical protein
MERKTERQQCEKSEQELFVVLGYNAAGYCFVLFLFWFGYMQFSDKVVEFVTYKGRVLEWTFLKTVIVNQRLLNVYTLLRKLKCSVIK